MNITSRKKRASKFNFDKNKIRPADPAAHWSAKPATVIPNSPYKELGSSDGVLNNAVAISHAIQAEREALIKPSVADVNKAFGITPGSKLTVSGVSDPELNGEYTVTAARTDSERIAEVIQVVNKHFNPKSASTTAYALTIQLSLGGVPLKLNLRNDEKDAARIEQIVQDVKSEFKEMYSGYYPQELIKKDGHPTLSAAAYMKYAKRLEGLGFEVDSQEFRKAHFSRKAA